jgi:hypothetical protein
MEARPWAGFHLIDAVKQMTFDWSLGRHPELLSGSFYQPLDQTVPHQFFATSMLVTPLLRGVFGWEPDAPLGRARLVPQLPPDWPEATVRGLRAGNTVLDVEIRQSWTSAGGQQRATIHWQGPRLDLDFVPDVPVGARNVTIAVDGVPAELPATGAIPVQVGGAGGGPAPAPSATPGRDDVTGIVVRWEGGLAVAPPAVDLEPGQRSNGLRVLDLAADGEGWTLALEGSPGHDYPLELYGTAVVAAADDGARATAVDPMAGEQPDDAVTRLRVRFADGGGRRATTIRLTPVGTGPG